MPDSHTRYTDIIGYLLFWIHTVRKTITIFYLHLSWWKDRPRLAIIFSFNLKKIYIGIFAWGRDIWQKKQNKTIFSESAEWSVLYVKKVKGFVAIFAFTHHLWHASGHPIWDIVSSVFCSKHTVWESEIYFCYLLVFLLVHSSVRLLLSMLNLSLAVVIFFS